MPLSDICVAWMILRNPHFHETLIRMPLSTIKKLKNKTKKPSTSLRNPQVSGNHHANPLRPNLCKCFQIWQPQPPPTISYNKIIQKTVTCFKFNEASETTRKKMKEIAWAQKEAPKTHVSRSVSFTSPTGKQRECWDVLLEFHQCNHLALYFGSTGVVAIIYNFSKVISNIAYTPK